MNAEKKMFHVRSKIWIEDDQGNVVFGLGRFKIFSAIKEHGSIHGASKAMKMGYRAIWARIKATEDRLGQKLLIKKTGGAKGGGSQLTPLTERLMEEFTKLHKHVEQESDDQFEKHLGPYILSKSSQSQK